MKVSRIEIMIIQMTLHFPFENTYARLPDRFYARVAPTPVQAPRLIRLNTQLALDLGLDPSWLAGPQGLEVLAGRLVPDSAEPIAMAYAGHQFGHFVPQLGDGRAILLGEIVDRQGVASASRAFGHREQTQAKTIRSMAINGIRPRLPRRSTMICCRSTKISASNAARDRNRSMTTSNIIRQRSNMTEEHHTILPPTPTGWNLR